VVELAPVGDCFLVPGDPLLQRPKLRIGPGVGIRLGDRCDLGYFRAQGTLGAPDRIGARTLLRRYRRRARAGETRQQGSLESRVLPADVDQFRDLVVALLQQHVDVGPGLDDVVLDEHQLVVERHRVNARYEQQQQEREAGHGCQASKSALTLTSAFSALPNSRSFAGLKPNRLAMMDAGNCSIVALLLLTLSL